jgi:hypothetical protein
MPLPRHHGRPRDQRGRLLLRLLTPRRLIEGPCRRRAPDPDPPRIWREAICDRPSGVAPEHQEALDPCHLQSKSKKTTPPQSPSPPRPARSGRGGAIRNSLEKTKALFWRSAEMEASWTPATGAERSPSNTRPALDLAEKPGLLLHH